MFSIPVSIIHLWQLKTVVSCIGHHAVDAVPLLNNVGLDSKHSSLFCLSYKEEKFHYDYNLLEKEGFCNPRQIGEMIFGATTFGITTFDIRHSA